MEQHKSNELNKGKIVVVGSINTDLVAMSKRMPAAGETVMGDTFFMNSGGKGANQAVAVARLGGDLTFVCKKGNDMFGERAINILKEEKIDTSYVFSDPDNPSGVALITVDENAENRIVVIPGANGTLSETDLKKAEKPLDEAEYLLMQMEIPMRTIEYAANVATAKGTKVILNPAPANKLSAELLSKLYLITPNETEAEIISGINVHDDESAIKAAAKITEMGVEKVVITLGSKGALIYENGKHEIVPAHKVKAVDTTAAGDVFNGAMTVALSEGKSLTEAVRFACKASAISVQRAGAQSSVPYRHEVENFIVNK
jgi:ribokinase